MRADANNLLERLGRQDFAYREFADRFAELEPWPLFEALLKDRRLFASARTDTGSTRVVAGGGEHRGAVQADFGPTNPGPAAASQTSFGAASSGPSLFHRYDSAPAEPQPAPQEAQDIRGLLQMLSRAEAGGQA